MLLFEVSLKILENMKVPIRLEIPANDIVPMICPKVIRSPKFEETKNKIGKLDKNIGVIKKIKFMFFY